VGEMRSGGKGVGVEEARGSGERKVGKREGERGVKMDMRRDWERNKRRGLREEYNGG